MTRPWVLKDSGGPEGQHRVASLDGEVEPAEEAVSDAVAAAQDDPPRRGPTARRRRNCQRLAHFAPCCLRCRRARSDSSRTSSP
jgi:hypothetical protein